MAPKNEPYVPLQRTSSSFTQAERSEVDQPILRDWRADEVTEHYEGRPSVRWTCLGIGLIVLASNLVGALTLWSAERFLSPAPSVGHGKSSTLQELLYLPPESRNFTPDPLLSLPATLESNKAWESLLGPSKGFLAIQNHEKYGIKPGLPYAPDRSKNVYGVSMFHQLHCLIMIRQRYFDFLSGRLTAQDFGHNASQGGKGEAYPTTVDVDHGSLHINHCFDYLQQGIRCAGQMDLEFAVKVGDVGFLAGEHQCKSWDAAMEIMKELSFEMPETMD